MKILYLTNLPSPYRVDFFNELVRCGFDVTVLFERCNAQNRNQNWQSEEKFLFQEIYLKSLKIGNESSFSFDAIKYLKKMNFDLFVIDGYSSITAMICIEYLKVKKIPFVISVDGGIISQDSWIKYKIKKHFLGAASAWLSSGSVTTNYLVHYGAKLKNVYEYPFSSIKNADIEKPLNEVEKEKLRKKMQLSERNTILFVGQFIYRKGIDVLLDSVRKLSSVKLNILLVGGEADENLKKIVNDYKLENVHFIPFKSKSKLKDYYKVTDVFVMPTRYDVWGLVINEAMGYGLPVVSTNQCVAAQTMITPGRNGFIVNVNDADALSEKIEFLLKNDEIRMSFAQMAFVTAQSYTIEHMARRHIEIFQALKGCS